MEAAAYNPFQPGPFAVEEKSFEARDAARDRVFPCAAWHPALPGKRPLVVFSHHSGGGRRAATFLTTHLASHGYLVAALDHSELFAPELKFQANDTGVERAARIALLSESRVRDVRFLIDHMLAHASADPDRIGIVGHSIGGWTALAAPESDSRVGAVVALAPGGASNPKPGIIPAVLTFSWSSPPAALYLVAERDVFLPLSGMHELYERTPGRKRMVILRRADHLHFVDRVEEVHEQTRATAFPGEAAWISQAMRPIGELCPGEEAHRFVRGLTVAHLDANLGGRAEAARFLSQDLAGALAANSIDAYEPRA